MSILRLSCGTQNEWMTSPVVATTFTRVNVVATTGDVIHSFWVPQLNRKIDMIPGRRNRVLLSSDKPGRYRGQCAEFCGLEHARMAMYVYVQEPADFRRWLRGVAAPARAPAGGLARADRSPDAAEHRRRASRLAARPAAREARQPDARPRPLRRRHPLARRLPAGAEVAMAVIDTPAGHRATERLERIWTERHGVLGWLTTTDHKRIGLLYLFASLVLFAAGGVEALLMRTQLIRPDNGLVGPGTYDELFTMHGITMIFLFVIPISTGAFGNYLLPLMIGARDMAFPRLNALSFWIFLSSGLLIYTSLAIGNAPDAGWFNYVPLAGPQFSPGPNIDFYCLGLIFNGISTTAAAINFIVTLFKMRAPGMSLNRMPLFCFAFLAVSFAIVFALPPLNVALIFLELDRQVGTHFYDVSQGGQPLMWQHLFW